MSSLVAYAGSQPAATVLLRGLARVDAQPDSAGVAIWAGADDVAITRAAGSLTPRKAGDDPLGAGRIGVGHLAIASHERARVRNAHPLVDCTERISIAHVGDIANAHALHAELEAGGHAFLSDADAEVVAHLLEDALPRAGSLLLALDAVVARLEGAWSIVALDHRTGDLAASADGSPLMLGRGAGGVLLASHAAAISDLSGTVQLLGRRDVVGIADDDVRWLRDGRTIAAPPSTAIRPQVVRGHAADDPSHHAIEDQPRAVARVLEAMASDVADGSLWRALALRPLERVAFVGSGTALHAGRVVASVLSGLGGVPTRWMLPSELATTALERGTLLVGLSTSADAPGLLHALDAPAARGLQLLVLSHAQHSPLARVADATLDRLAPPDVGAAASTFAGQTVAGIAVALSALVASGRIDRASAAAHAASLHETPARLHDAVTGAMHDVAALVDELRDTSTFLYVGAGSGIPYAAEGALQLQQLAARWAQHHPASELLHAPLRFVDASTGVFVVDSGSADVDAAIAQLTARGARVLRIGGLRADIGVGLRRGRTGRGMPWDATPWGPIEAIVPMQLFARELGRDLGFVGADARV